MKIKINKNQLLKKSVIIFKFFFITKLPMAGLAGLKLKEINYSILKRMFIFYLIRTHLNQHTFLLKV